MEACRREGHDFLHESGGRLVLKAVLMYKSGLNGRLTAKWYILCSWVGLSAVAVVRKVAALRSQGRCAAFTPLH
jgi:hypothetical protein